MANIYGYCRVSSKKQKIGRQVNKVRSEYPNAIIYREKYTGTTLARPAFEELLKVLKKGDTLVFDDVSRMSRNAQEGIELYEKLFYDGINIIFIAQSSLNTSHYAEALKPKLDLNVENETINQILKLINEIISTIIKSQFIAAFEAAEKEVLEIRRRTKEGLAKAKIDGKTLGRKKGIKIETKKSKRAKKQIIELSRDFEGNLKDSDCIKIIKISKNSYYKYKREILEDGFESIKINEQ